MMIDIDKLDYWLQPKGAIFRDLQDFAKYKNCKSKRHIFRDRSADVLFVAHLDTVQKPGFVKLKKNRIYAAGLDDRLGCLIAWSLGERYGADVLLTDNEETGQTTAQFFDCMKDYNFIVEFDRAGDDVVTYGLDSADFCAALKKHWRIGTGSYSDIAELQTDACCVNVGIGYERAHSRDSFADLDTLKKQLARFDRFYRDNCAVEYKQDFHDEYGDPWGDDRTEYGDCEMCGNPAALDVYGRFICEDCFYTMLERALV